MSTFTEKVSLENTFGLDAYDRRARLIPVLLVALPLALVAAVWAPGGTAAWSPLWLIAVGCGIAYLFADLAREAGKRIEADLFRKWNGPPTRRLLRHQSETPTPLLHRRHLLIESITGETLPSAEEEQKEPHITDEIYDTCIHVLRERTREKDRFPLVFAENCAYGFRRNSLGLRPYGIAASALSLIILAALISPQLPVSAALGEPFTLIIGAVCVGLLLFWLFVVKPAWVRSKAEAYAERLLAAGEKLYRDKPESM